MTLPVRLDIPAVEVHSDLDRRIKLADALNLTGSAQWSIYEVVDRMDDIATKGKNLTLVYHAGRDHMGEHDVKISLPENPTWRQLAHAAADAISKSGDTKHTLIQAFMRKRATLIMFVGC